MNHIYNEQTEHKETYETLLKQDPEHWSCSMANKLGRLAQGVGERMKTGNNNIFYIKKSNTQRTPNHLLHQCV